MAEETYFIAKEIGFNYPQKVLFQDLSVSIPGQKIIGLVGVNGAGKSTLLKILAGRLEIDSGEIQTKNDLKIGCVDQVFDLDESNQNLSLAEYIFVDIQQEPELYTHQQAKYNSLKEYFDLPDLDLQVSQLSGGQRRKLALLKVFLAEPDLLLLDEPTNHLDLRSIHNLEVLLRQFLGTVVIISHDRYFLDRVCQQIWELENSQIYTYSGNYSTYLQAKAKRYEILARQHEKQKQQLKRELEWVRSGVRARGTKDAGRLKRYEELAAKHKQTKPIWQNPKLPIPKPLSLGDKVLEFSDFGVDLPSQEPLLRNLDFKFEKGFRLGILGPNGSGKTTFIRQLLKTASQQLGLNPENQKNLKNLDLGGEVNYLGQVVFGINTIFNYQDQHRFNLQENLSIKENILPNKGQVEMKFGSQKTNIYAYLKKFLFQPKELDKPVSSLSGGQRARLLLALILARGGNFLILDEPTNDLDIETLESLEKTLLEFPGCQIIISHDRYFLDRVCTHLLSLEGFGNYILSTGGYSEYIRKYGSKSRFYSFEVEDNQGSDLAVLKPSVEADYYSTSANSNSLQSSQTSESKKSKSRLNPKEKRQLKAELRALDREIEELSKRIENKQKQQSRPDFFQQETLEIENFNRILQGQQVDLMEKQYRVLEIEEELGM